MRYVTLVLLTLLLLCGVYFYALNQDLIVESISLGFYDFEFVNLYMIVFGAVLFGIIWALLVFLAQEIRLRFKLMQLRSENKKLKKEVDILRTQPLEEIDPSKYGGENA